MRVVNITKISHDKGLKRMLGLVLPMKLWFYTSSNAQADMY